MCERKPLCCLNVCALYNPLVYNIISTLLLNLCNVRLAMGKNN